MVLDNPEENPTAEAVEQAPGDGDNVAPQALESQGNYDNVGGYEDDEEDEDEDDDNECDDDEDEDDDDECEQGFCGFCYAGLEPEDWPSLASGELVIKGGVCDQCYVGECEFCGQRRARGDGVCYGCQRCSQCTAEFPDDRSRPVRDGLCEECGTYCEGCSQRLDNDEQPVCTECMLCMDCSMDGTRDACPGCTALCTGCDAILNREAVLDRGGTCPRCGKAIDSSADGGIDEDEEQEQDKPRANKRLKVDCRES